MDGPTGVKMSLFQKLNFRKWAGAPCAQRVSSLRITAFVFPLIVLMGIAGVSEYHLKTGRTLVLPVEGYDPRDLLSGRYLMYKINYGLKCPERTQENLRCGKQNRLRCTPSAGKVRAYMCFEPEKYITFFNPPENCSFFLKGRCLPNKTFYTRTDRYYLPEKQAQKIEQIFRAGKKKSVVLSVTKTGRAFAKDILIDGKSLQNLIRRP